MSATYFQMVKKKTVTTQTHTYIDNDIRRNGKNVTKCYLLVNIELFQRLSVLP